MAMPWNRKQKTQVNEEISQTSTVSADAETEGLPAFFLTRTIGWCAVAVAILALTFFWSRTSTVYSGNLMGGAGFIALIAVFNGYRIWRIGKKGEFFTLRLTCIDIRALGAVENIPSYINPASNTAFKGSQQVTFETETGTKVIFSYERNRKFLVGARYDFYFNKNQEGEKVTVDMLERLRIDHAIVRDELSSDDISAEINIRKGEGDDQ